MTARDDLSTSTIALVGLVGAIVVFAIIILLMVVFYRVEARQHVLKDVDQRYTQVSQLVANQEGRLASYGWVDPQKRIAYIPIDRAMALVVAELSRDPAARVIGAVQTPAATAAGVVSPAGGDSDSPVKKEGQDAQHKE